MNNLQDVLAQYLQMQNQGQGGGMANPMMQGMAMPFGQGGQRPIPQFPQGGSPQARPQGFTPYPLMGGMGQGMQGMQGMAQEMPEFLKRGRGQGRQLREMGFKPRQMRQMYNQRNPMGQWSPYAGGMEHASAQAQMDQQNMAQPMNQGNPMNPWQQYLKR